jgi:catechol-2,3-dioxygenase
MNSEIPSFGLAQLGQIGMSIDDLDRAIAFYRDILGMKLCSPLRRASPFFPVALSV